MGYVMAKRKYTNPNNHEQEANAYKARAEGKAAIIRALMPLLMVVVILMALFVAPKLGVDLVPYAEALTAVWLGNTPVLP